MQVSGSNFQSWEKFAFKVEGLTVVVGPSNLGKSALFRAVRAALRNDLSASHIKVGEKSCSVAVEDITIKRGTGAATYDIAGKEYSKLGANLPPGIQERGLGVVEIGDMEIDPIFATQFDAQFGLSWTPAQVGVVLGAFSATDKLEAGKKRLNKQISEMQLEAKVLAEEHSALEATTGLAGPCVSRVDPLIESIKTCAGSVAKAQDVFSKLSGVPVVVEESASLKGVLDRLRLPSDSEFTSVRTLLQKTSLLAAEYRCLAESLELSGKISPLNANATIIDSKLETVKREKRVVDSLRRYLDVKKESASLGKVKVPCDSIDSAVAKVKNSREILMNLEKAMDLLAHKPLVLPVIPPMPSNKIVASLRNLITLMEERKENRLELKGVQGELLAVEDELHELLKHTNLITCPSCGHQFEAEK